MEQIPTMVDGVTSLAAALFNQIPDETENAILSTGQALTNADLFQLTKTLAVYSGRGNFYNDVGVANTYTLAVFGSTGSPSDDDEGTFVRFRVANTNTGASTVQLPGLTSRTIVRADGSPLQAGDLALGDVVALQRRSASYRLFNFEQVQTAVEALGDLAFEDMVTSAFIQNGTIINEDVSNSSIDLEKFNGDTRERLTTQFGGEFDFVNGSLSLSMTNLFANTPAKNHLIYFDCHVSGQIQNKELQFQFFRGGVLFQGNSDYAWSFTNNAGSNGDNLDSKMGCRYTIADGGANIVYLRGYMLICQPDTPERANITGQFTASNDQASDGVNNISFAGSMNSNSGTNITGLRIRVGTAGSGILNGGTIRHYAIGSTPS